MFEGITLFDKNNMALRGQSKQLFIPCKKMLQKRTHKPSRPCTIYS